MFVRIKNQYLVLLMGISVLTLILGACSPKPTPTKIDSPAISKDEACALVYNYLEIKATATTIIGPRRELLDWLGKARPYFTATYISNGKWEVQAVGNDGDGSRGVLTGDSSGLWNVYENSRVVEPANDKARELLSYIQFLTR